MSWQSQADAGQLQLAWIDNANNEDGFQIERKTGTVGSYTQIATVGPNITSYSDFSLADGATYCYRVRAFNSAGNSAYTLERCAAARSMARPSDYDGDGKADVAVYRDGYWYILRSSDGGVTAIGWGGMAQDIPVPRDYDGDGKADIAVYRGGYWYILRSSDGGVTSTGWGGMAQDIPVAGDYDGDGKADVAVYRDGGWYILRSSDAGMTFVELGGAAGDIPLN